MAVRAVAVDDELEVEFGREVPPAAAGRRGTPGDGDGDGDGRILYFNKHVPQKAGQPTDWRPNSCADIISAARPTERERTRLPLEGTMTTLMQSELDEIPAVACRVLVDGAGEAEQVAATNGHRSPAAPR